MDYKTTTSSPMSSRHVQVAKIVWLVLVTLNLTLYILGSVIYFRELSSLCDGTLRACHDRSRITQEDLTRLNADGMGLEDWGRGTSPITQ